MPGIFCHEHGVGVVAIIPAEYLRTIAASAAAARRDQRAAEQTEPLVGDDGHGNFPHCIGVTALGVEGGEKPPARSRAMIFGAMPPAM